MQTRPAGSEIGAPVECGLLASRSKRLTNRTTCGWTASGSMRFACAQVRRTARTGRFAGASYPSGEAHLDSEAAIVPAAARPAVAEVSAHIGQHRNSARNPALRGILRLAWGI